MTSHILKYKGRFSFEAGGYVDGLEVAYHTSPEPYIAGDKRKVIWLCHALTASSDAEGQWWPKLVGPGKLIDTDKYFVICGNMLGSAYGSSGPSSLNPATGKPYFFDFPKVTVRDIVNALDLVRKSLGISKIDFLIGTSIGGFQALEWCVKNPELMERAAFIATGARVTPWITGFEESQRLALEADPTFRECKDLNGGKEALKCARIIAMLSYRCEKGYNIKQKEKGDDTMFADRAASYVRYQGNKFVTDFDAYSYYYLSYSVDSNNLGRGRGGVKEALKMIKAESTVAAIDSDLLFPPAEMKSLAEGINGAAFHIIHSNFGHDGFMVETQQLSELLQPLMP
ncbi:MAG: homoserine O-acetyltransferase [Bacteroidales bacterium]|jgi:homoserine O-acetyltransferase|nr:homoserine O-acetyltransferase [Bacteroidales bacterium]MCI1786253.1 homoserine O-acetyltransferase [Bacteroidales bacterium]